MPVPRPAPHPTGFRVQHDTCRDIESLIFSAQVEAASRDERRPSTFGPTRPQSVLREWLAAEADDDRRAQLEIAIASQERADRVDHSAELLSAEGC